jgi:hypothetical protein
VCVSCWRDCNIAGCTEAHTRAGAHARMLSLARRSSTLHGTELVSSVQLADFADQGVAMENSAHRPGDSDETQRSAERAYESAGHSYSNDETEEARRECSPMCTAAWDAERAELELEILQLKLRVAHLEIALFRQRTHGRAQGPGRASVL